jgi:enterochelin esterase-like enzyme
VAAARFLLTGSVSRGGGRITTIAIGAPALGVPAATTYVYLPPGYAEHPDRRYPVAYLLHGSPGVSSDWFAAGDAAHTLDVLIAHREVPPMIVVAPDTNGGGLHDTECLDDPAPGGAKVETYLRTVVVPRVDATYRTDARPAARIIGGMSAGGFCALDQGLRHQDTYGPVVALEPFGDPGAQFVRTLGRAGFTAVSPSSYLPTVAEPGPVPVFLGTGALAAEKGGVDALTRQLRARGWPVLRRDVRGQGHTWTTAREDLAYGLVFAARYLPAADRG